MQKYGWRYYMVIPFLLILSSSLSAEPYQHPETMLIFPDRFAGLEKLSVKNYEKDNPGLGISVGYGAPGGTATIYLYTMGMKSVPSKIGDPQFKKHFRQVVEEVFLSGENGTYKDVRKTGEEETVFGASKTGIKALSASFTFVIAHSGTAVFSKLYLMSYNNHFLKLRFTYPRDMRLQGESILKVFIENLVVMIESADALKLEVSGNHRSLERKSIYGSDLSLNSEGDVKVLKKFITDIEYHLELNPDWNNEAWGARAVAHSRLGNIGPLNALKMYSKGVKESAEGIFNNALQSYEKACRLDPRFPWSANNMAWVLATCPDKGLRDGRRAIEYAKQAIKVQKIDVPDFINTLAAAHAAAGDFDSAVRLCRKSIDLQPQDQYRAMLASFLNRTVYISARPDIQK
jgi:hypothetical protein